MKKTAAADIVIFGGGVAGLWLLHRLRQAGLSAILFESGALGGGQTHKAQGIIHGGMKYALQGVLNNEAKAMADMPTVWKACLAGKGEIDLSHVPVLSTQQCLWSPGKFTSKLTGFLAGATLNSDVTALTRDAYPNIFKNPAFKGDVYALDELIIDVPILVRELVKASQDAVFKIEPLSDEEFKFDDDGNLLSATLYMSGDAVQITAQQFIFTAGAGNEFIIKRFKTQEVAMQRRPLHMVLMKLPPGYDYPLYAHCLGLGSRPRITITTHYLKDGSPVWYLGGLIAEDGVGRDSEAQIAAARAELSALFPWLDFSQAEFATFMVDRAEPAQKNGLKPESVYSKAVNNAIIAWPTKLALAPKLADDIMQQLKHVKPHLCDVRELRSWPMPPLATPVWEDAFCKHGA